MAGFSSIGKGQANTNAILASCTPTISYTFAASVCDDFVLNGYSDWYLPSRYELTQLYLNREVIGGFIQNSYWSSTNMNASTAWTRSFFSGSEEQSNKEYGFRIRAVRSF